MRLFSVVRTILWRRLPRWFFVCAVFAAIRHMVLRWSSRRKVRITHHAASTLAKSLLDKCHALKNYNPVPYLPSGILQTVSTSWLSTRELPFEREVLHLPKMTRPAGRICCPAVVLAGQVSLDWLAPTTGTEAADSPILIVVPGLTGDSSAGYVSRIADHSNQEGMRVACYNPRSRGGNPVTTPLIYSVGFTEDFRRAVSHIKTRFPSAPLFAVGFSLGSNYLAKYVGEEGDDCPLSGVCCLACPIDCLSMSNNLNNALLSRYILDPFLVNLVQQVREEHEEVMVMHPKISIENVTKSKTMSEFDHHAIAPMFDFDCGSDYYRFSSSGLYLSKIRTPTLFLHAYNDPIVPGHCIRLDNFSSNPHLLSVMTSWGGHSMDWPSGWTFTPWAPKAVLQFIGAIQDNNRIMQASV